MSCVKLSSFCGKSSERTGRQTPQDRATQHNGRHRAGHGLHERCCARVRDVARVVRDMTAVESGVRRSPMPRSDHLPRARPDGAEPPPPRPQAKTQAPPDQGESVYRRRLDHRRRDIKQQVLARGGTNKTAYTALPPHLIPTRARHSAATEPGDSTHAHDIHSSKQVTSQLSGASISNHRHTCVDTVRG